MKITVLTTTFYQSTTELRFHLACQLVGNAIGAGHDVVIVDGSPDDTVYEAFKKIGARVYKQTSRDMGGSRRELFKIALDCNDEKSIFLWVEPEKVDVIRLIPKIIAPLEQNEAEIVIPSRTQKSWESYPTFQVASEQKANFVYLETIGKPFDPMFGPVAYKRGVAAFFAECNPAQEFGATDGYIQHFAPLNAMAKGSCNIISVPVDFYYPLAQRIHEESGILDEMIRKRQWQLDQLVAGYRLAAKALDFPKREGLVFSS